MFADSDGEADHAEVSLSASDGGSDADHPEGEPDRVCGAERWPIFAMVHAELNLQPDG